MKDFNDKMAALAGALDSLAAVCTEIVDLSTELSEDACKPEKMKNCVNCDHSEICLVVAQRKAKHANDYSPCSKWKLVEK